MFVLRLPNIIVSLLLSSVVFFMCTVNTQFALAALVIVGVLMGSVCIGSAFAGMKELKSKER